MNPRPLPPATEAERILMVLEARRRRRFTLVVTSTSAMLAGLTVGYAFGLQHAFQRALTRGDQDGI